MLLYLNIRFLYQRPIKLFLILFSKIFLDAFWHNRSYTNTIIRIFFTTFVLHHLLKAYLNISAGAKPIYQ